MNVATTEGRTRRIAILTTRHQQADETLLAEQTKLVPNEQKVKSLKRLKLSYKDQIAVLGRTADVVAFPIPSNTTPVQQRAVA